MPAAPDAAEKAISYATAQVGKPYVWGSTGPRGYDCSGLVMMSYRQGGVNLPRVTGLMINSGAEVRKDRLKRGDLVFPNPGHVQIYLGGGKVIEAPTRGIPVRIVSMWGFWRARRVAQPSDKGGIDLPDLPGIPNPLDAGKEIAGNVKQIYEVFQTFAKAAAWLNDPHNWLRIAMFGSGFILLFASMIGAQRAGTVTKAVTKGAINAAKP